MRSRVPIPSSALAVLSNQCEGWVIFRINPNSTDEYRQMMAAYMDGYEHWGDLIQIHVGTKMASMWNSFQIYVGIKIEGDTR